MRQILHQQNHITLQRYFRHFGYLDSYPSHNTIWSGSNSYCSTVATPDIDPESYSVTRRTRGPAADGMGLVEPWYWQHGDGDRFNPDNCHNLSKMLGTTYLSSTGGTVYPRGNWSYGFLLIHIINTLAPNIENNYIFIKPCRLSDTSLI